MANKSNIRELNIAFWRNPHTNGRLTMTSSVAAMDNLFVLKCIHALAIYDAWNKDNDPYGEADMCTVEIDGTKVWPKLDYYDKTMDAGSEDPADPDQTTRVGTIMLPSDY